MGHIKNYRYCYISRRIRSNITAVKAAQSISIGIHNLNKDIKLDFAEELRFGMGIHVGNTIVGMMGYGKTVSETAVGDNVNVASRLEELSKKFTCELVISKDVLELSKIKPDQFSSHRVNIRGRSNELEVYTLDNAEKISFG